MKRRIPQLYGLMFRPIFNSKKEYVKQVGSAKGAVQKDFKDAYKLHIGSMQIIAYCAKLYADKNWKKIKDWSDLEIRLKDKDGNETHYYKYVDRRKPSVLSKISNPKLKASIRPSPAKAMFDRLEKEDKKNQNPVKTINVTLDYSDGDFSLDVNRKPHWFIDDESAVVFADFIERKLDKKKIKKS